MSRGWFSSVIHTEPSTAHTVLPAPSTTRRVWFGSSCTAPCLSSIRISAPCVWYAQDACLRSSAQTVNIRDSHAKSECVAGAGPARGLRVRGAPPLLHQGRGRTFPHPVGG